MWSANLDAPALRAATGIATGGKYCNIRCHALRAATGFAGLAAARLLARVLVGIGATLDRERNRETEREGDRDR